MCIRDRLQVSQYLEILICQYFLITANLTSKVTPPVISSPKIQIFLPESDSTLKKYAISKKKVTQSEQRFKSYSLSKIHILLFYKGFQGLAAYRASHSLWTNDRHTMALFIQNRSSEVFGVDIHPAASIDSAVMIDHATGVVVGETAVIKKNVSIFQGVTLGGKGFVDGDRHPKVEEGVSIFASSTILGNITLGKNSIVAAGSLVLDDVDANTTVAGIPAKKLN